ncbi:hypothetical protein PR048_000797 [Dryococelus australis]|uniref:Uncharacterized protein n=1 Tax=Dryococelus australis TaxID=614101 RepID=A0ABQ9IGV5_9NEOP|nr:hypothetical protein PR048_000797 [Dryococelus australis]
MKSLKTHYDAELVKWQKHRIGQKLQKKTFVKLVSTLWRELDPNITKFDFRKGGIYPFNRDVIPQEKFDKQRLQLRNQINRPHLQAGSSNEVSMVREPAVVQAGSSIEGSVVHESEVVQAGSSYKGSVVCSEVVSQCDPNPPVVEISVSRARARTFEELVLETIENHQSTEKKKKTRLEKEAEVITSDDVYARIRDQDKKKAEAQKRKLENKKNSSKKTMKRKREEI